jgi:hypothetical protein
LTLCLFPCNFCCLFSFLLPASISTPSTTSCKIQLCPPPPTTPISYP